MEDKFDLWCIVELFGHAKIAGRCTEQNIAGTNMLRVDVPETAAHPAFTRFFGSSSIYSISPVDEKTACHMAERINSRPIDSYDVSAIVKKHSLLTASKTVEKEEDYPMGPHENDDDDDDRGAFDESGY
jgi:hypothetical protein